MAISRIDAINRILIAMGEALVQTVDPDPDSESATISFLIDYHTRELCNYKWHWNTKYVTLTRDVNNELLLPTGTLQFGPPPEWRNQIAKRGDKVFNRIDNTFEFSCDIHDVEIVESLDFDDIPDAAQNWVVAWAGRQSVEGITGSSERAGFTQDDINNAFSILQSDQADTSAATMFDNTRVRRTLNRAPRAFQGFP